MKRILLSLVAVLMFAGILHAAGTSSPITGFSWDNVRKVVRFMTSDGNEITVDQTPKTYLAGKTYNGVLLDVAGTNSFVLNSGYLIPYRTSDGTWRLKFNIAAFSTTNTTSHSISIAGVTFVNGSHQAAACTSLSNAVASGGAYAQQNSGVVVCTFTSNYGTPVYSGDVVLAGKPTWVD